MMKSRFSFFRLGFLITLFLLHGTPSAFAGTYWVAVNGGAIWSACESATQVSGAAACSLPTANASAVAGDTIKLLSGTYNTPIQPSNSGAPGSVITYEAHGGHTPVISGTFHGILLSNVDYIKIDGITIRDVQRWAEIRNHSDYNEITNSTFTDTDGLGTSFWVWDSNSQVRNLPSTNNWLHHNTMYGSGSVTASCDDGGGVLFLGIWAGTGGQQRDSHNTIEDNVMYWGGHHVLETNSQFNVIRNNVFHNEGWMDDPGNCQWGPSPRNGKYGNRNIQIYDGVGTASKSNLIEGNRIGHAAFASDGGMDGNLVITSRANIIRYNDSYYSETFGLYFKAGANSPGSNNRAYNNTITHNGQDSIAYPSAWTGFGALDWRKGVHFHNFVSDNVVKNNIIYNSGDEDESCGGSCLSNNNVLTNNWTTSNGNPLFVNPDMSQPSSKVVPNLELQSGSGAIDTGTYLTQASGSGSSSTTLVLDDALYFQDGTWGSRLSNVQADWIAIGDVGTFVRISSINYATNTVTLSSPMSWSDNAPVWLYRDSTGRQVLHGTAPDIGAHESLSSSTPPPSSPPAPPQNLRIVAGG